jgi:hypothetical protein
LAGMDNLLDEMVDKIYNARIKEADREVDL